MALLESEEALADPRSGLYRRSVRANRLAALAAVYPVVRRLVGADFFAACAEVFARAHPSRSGDLHGFGAELGSFLEGYTPATALAYLADVARLEWALHESYHAADAPPFDFASLAAVPPQRHGDVRLRLHPAVRLLRPAFPVVAIWEANQPGCDATPRRAEGPEHVLVLRQGYRPLPYAISACDYELLAGMASHATLGALSDRMGEDAGRLEQLLPYYAAAGAICGFELAA